MFVELIEHLRCPNEHEDSGLVATAGTTENRHIRDGVLGCPVCRAEFPIREAVAEFGGRPPVAALDVPSDETAMRLAAFLELTDAHGFALLCGRWAVHLDPLQQLTRAPIVVINPSSAVPVRRAAGAIRGEVIPFGEGSARAIALDDGSSASIVASGVRAVRAGGRVLGPSTLPVPAGVTELVRDSQMWVGEKTATPARAPRLVPLAKRRG